MKEILQKDTVALRAKAADVPVADIASSQIQKTIDEMFEALEREKDGIAIAAPQIGVSKRIFVVSPRINEPDDSDNSESNPEESAGEKQSDTPLVYINPRITKLSKNKEPMPEGCLSCRWWYGKVDRAVKATVIACDRGGRKFTRGASGLLAQIFQHEIDHLDGILFVDKAHELRELTEEEWHHRDEDADQTP